MGISDLPDMNAQPLQGQKLKTYKNLSDPFHYSYHTIKSYVYLLSYLPNRDINEQKLDTFNSGKHKVVDWG